MKTRVEQLLREFSKGDMNIENLSHIFSSLNSVKNSAGPNPKFKKRLGNRLSSLSHIQHMSYQVQKRRTHLFFGTFASFLFLGVFVYYIGTTFFHNPIQDNTRNIHIPQVLDSSGGNQEEGDNVEKASIKQAPIYIEPEIVPGIKSFGIQRNEDSSTDGKESEEEVFQNILDEDQGELNENQSTIEVRKENKVEQKEEEDVIISSGEEKIISDEAGAVTVSEFSAESESMGNGESDADIMVSPESSLMDEVSSMPFLEDFNEYCVKNDGVYLSYGVTPECHKGETICTMDVYESRGLCPGFQKNDTIQKNEDEIDLQDLIDEYEEE